MVFKNEEQLKDFLLDKAGYALKNAQNEIYHIIQQFVKEFYADYSPVMYERTYQLYNSLVKSGVEWNGSNGYKVYVYFDYDSLNYITGAQPSGEQVMEAAAYGGHGAEGLRVMSGNSGINIWNDPMQVISAEAIGILKRKLMEQGIPIK